MAETLTEDELRRLRFLRRFILDGIVEPGERTLVVLSDGTEHLARIEKRPGALPLGRREPGRSPN